MSFLSGGGGGGDSPVMPGYGNKTLQAYMTKWRKQQGDKAGMDSTVLAGWAGEGTGESKTVLGDAWLTK